MPSQISYHNESTHVMVFQLNHNNSLGWHYGWVGSSNQVHRACLHHLVGYVVEYAGGDTTKFRVVQSTASPPFIVMSYRRACYVCQKHRPQHDRTPPPSSDCACEGEFNNKRQQHVIHTSMHVSGSARADGPLDEPTAMERHLSVFIAFVSVPSIHFFSAQLPTLNDRLVDGLLQPMAAALGLPPDRTRALSVPTTTIRPVAAESTITSNLASLISFCFDLALSTLTFESLQQHASFFSDNAIHLLDRDTLHQAFLEWIQRTHHVLSTRLAPVGMTMAQLTQTILQTATHVRELHSLERHIKGLNDAAASDQNSPGFDYFVAQLREVYMAGNAASIPCAVVAASSKFDGRWMYHTTVTVVYGAATSPELDFSLATFLRCLTMGYSFQVRLVDDHVLQIKSDLMAYNTMWSEFILDSTPRVFRVFPNGESSMTQLSGLLHGDYIGRKLGEDIVCVDVFSWPWAQQTNISRVTVMLQLAPDQSALTVSLAVGTAALSSASDDALVDFATLSATERYASYNTDKEVASANVCFRYAPCK
ncbi:hypothetical protein, variant [Aphanomyces invadans]|nr:hypothetical protein, variant [Aphanomyces invadans]ETW03880.1 hypothetical protein, variant [Aphanomyces invadans]|eukprot:XP_008866836.1 hypothetical protein, variant [Aphanomyces invadans]